MLVHSAHLLSQSENRLCAVPVKQCTALSAATTAFVTACRAQPTNQYTDIQHAGIFARTGAVYGSMRDVSLTDYFQELRVANQESNVGATSRLRKITLLHA